MLKLKSVMSMAVIPILLIGNLTACTFGGKTPTTTKNEPDEIRVMVEQSSTAAVDKITDMEKIFQDKLKIKFVKTVVPVDNRIEKRNVLMASGSLDIVYLEAQTLDYYAQSGSLVDLTDLIPQKLPNYEKIFDQKLREIYSINGRIYSLPNALAKFKPGMKPGDPFTPHVFMIRQDWLDNLNLQAPKTMDDMFNVAKAFYDADLDHVGKDNLGIIGGCNGFGWNNFNWIFGAFGSTLNANANSTWYLDEKADQITSYDIHPGSKEALAWMQKAYSANLIDKDFITQKEPQMKDKVISGKTGIFAFHYVAPLFSSWCYDLEERKLRENGRLKDGEKYVPDRSKPMTYWSSIEVPRGPRGEYGEYTWVPSLDWSYAIPKNGKNLDAVLRLMDYLSTKEGAMLKKYGELGKDYVMDAERGPLPGPAVGDKPLKEYKEMRGLSIPVGCFGSSFYQLSQDYDWATYYGSEVASYGKGPADMHMESLKNMNSKYTDFANANGLVIPSGKNIKPKLDALRDEYYSKIVLGIYDIDKFDEFADKWKKSGGDQLIKEYTDAYRAKKSK